MRSNYQGISINTSKNTHESVFSLISRHYDNTIVDIEHGNFVVGDMTKILPLSDESCDVVVCIDGIEHISGQFNFVKEIFRILKNQGECIISTPNISSLRSRWKWLTTGHHHKCKSPLNENNPSPLHHIGMISFPEIRYLLHTNGFSISEI